ncbi:MAG: PepSY domain-containing protein [Candidatus Eremiobacteraeota bacterium]|nr:PepSY domain-containing protein [Candidatus Eremiobacteraeota bacterium]MBC5828427.1 PepSY domain-containing protein [Candidatus Eremiobacteraeota bacterium]
MTSKFAIALGGTIIAGTAAAMAYSGQNLERYAHVSLKQAEAIAIRATHGRIVDEELEKEAGGTGLRYSFGVIASGHKREVGVDAKTGKVLENMKEGANPD